MWTQFKIWLISKLLPENYEIIRRKYEYKAITLDKDDYYVNKVSFSDCN